MPAELIAARTVEWTIIKFFGVTAHNYIIHRFSLVHGQAMSFWKEIQKAYKNQM